MMEEITEVATKGLSIKNMLIAAAIAFVLGIGVGVVPVYKYVTNKYEAQIQTEHSLQRKALAEETTKRLAEERKNSDLTNQLEQMSIEANKKLAALRSANIKLARDNGGLYVRASCDQTSNSVASSPASSIASGASYCKLADDVGAILLEKAAISEEVEAYARLAHEYAIAIDKFRKEHLND